MQALTVSPRKQTKYRQHPDAACPKSPTGAHHWMVDMPTPEGMKGACRWCGAEKDYRGKGSMDFIPAMILHRFQANSPKPETEARMVGKLNLRRTW